VKPTGRWSGEAGLVRYPNLARLSLRKRSSLSDLSKAVNHTKGIICDPWVKV
jgi:hypothetical protein